MARYIFVTGGVVSSLGKGLSSASLAYLLQSQGFKVRLRKLDPYLNVHPGTMSPFQHGFCWFWLVTIGFWTKPAAARVANCVHLSHYVASKETCCSGNGNLHKILHGFGVLQSPQFNKFCCINLKWLGRGHEKKSCCRRSSALML